MAEGLSRTFWLAAGSVAGMILGCLGTWAKAFGALSVSGLDTDDGKLFGGVAVGAAAALLLAVRRRRHRLLLLVTVLGLGGTGIGIYEIIDLSNRDTDFFGEQVDVIDPGWGLWLSLGASASLVISSLLLYLEGRPASTPSGSTINKGGRPSVTLHIPRWLLLLGGFLLAAGAGVGVTLLATADDESSKQATATTEATVGSEADKSRPSTSDCDELGINPEVGNEGRCEEKGVTFTVVNRDSVLHFDGLSARLLDISQQSSVSSEFDSATASGLFVLIHLELTNKRNRPVMFDQGADQIALSTSGKNYTQDFNVANGVVENSCMFGQPEEVQPDVSKRCIAVFDIPTRAARRVEQDGNVLIGSTGGYEGVLDSDRVGVIRAYR
jgi:hypothetical protein